MTDCPDYPTRVYAHPLDYFRGDTESKGSFGTWLIITSTSVICTFGASLMFNGYTRRPYKSGIQRHIAMAVFGVVFANWFHNYRLDYLAERDAVLRHYIETHPDDFPPYERQKYRDVLRPWVPRR